MPKHNPPHPGEYILEECLKPLNLSIGQAAKGLGVNRSTLSRLIHGKSRVSPDMAVRLSMAFGSTPEMWLRLQNAFDLAQARREAKNIHIQRFEPV